MTLEHEEPPWMLPNPLVIVHGERDDRVAPERCALTAEPRPVILPRPQSSLDCLVHLSVQPLVASDPLECRPIHDHIVACPPPPGSAGSPKGVGAVYLPWNGRHPPRSSRGGPRRCCRGTRAAGRDPARRTRRLAARRRPGRHAGDRSACDRRRPLRPRAAGSRPAACPQSGSAPRPCVRTRSARAGDRHRVVRRGCPCTSRRLNGARRRDRRRGPRTRGPSPARRPPASSRRGSGTRRSWRCELPTPRTNVRRS